MCAPQQRHPRQAAAAAEGGGGGGGASGGSKGSQHPLAAARQAPTVTLGVVRISAYTTLSSAMSSITCWAVKTQARAFGAEGESR